MVQTQTARYLWDGSRLGEGVTFPAQHLDTSWIFSLKHNTPFPNLAPGYMQIFLPWDPEDLLWWKVKMCLFEKSSRGLLGPGWQAP